jgi:hypothetical protein
MKPLLSKSNQIKADADKLLAESNLVEILSLYGDVKFVGSYPLNVMLRSDLDVYAITKENNREKMLEIVQKIFASNYFDEICFANWNDFEIDNEVGIKGYYIQPFVTIGENRWKLDVWLMTEDQFKPYTEEFLELIKDDPNEEKRLAILKLKETFAEGEKYVTGINGKLIYKAVLQDNIRTPEQFKIYLEENNEDSTK